METQTTLPTLPSKLSDLLELAVDDAQAVSKTPGVTLRMTSWQNAFSDRPCTVCLGGAILLRHGVTKIGQLVQGFNELERLIGKSDAKALCRIDAARRGGLHRGGLAATPLKDPAYKCLEPIRRTYDPTLDGGRSPWKFYRQSIRRLRRNGL